MIGRAEVISTVGRRALQSFHAAAYTADNLVVAAAGNLEHGRLTEMLGARWVTGVLCVRTDEPPRYVDDKFWVVSHDDVFEFIAKQRGPAFDPRLLRAALAPVERRGRMRRAIEALRTPT